MDQKTDIPFLIYEETPPIWEGSDCKIEWWRGAQQQQYLTGEKKNSTWRSFCNRPSEKESLRIFLLLHIFEMGRIDLFFSSAGEKKIHHDDPFATYLRKGITKDLSLLLHIFEMGRIDLFFSSACASLYHQGSLYVNRLLSGSMWKWDLLLIFYGALGSDWNKRAINPIRVLMASEPYIISAVGGTGSLPTMSLPVENQDQDRAASGSGAGSFFVIMTN